MTIDMAFLKLLLCIGILYITVQETAKASASTSNDTYSLQDIKPHHFTIKIAPATEFRVFVGECNVFIEILKPTRNITLHSKNLAVKKATLIKRQPQVTEENLQGSKDTVTVYETTWHEHNITTGILILHFNSDLLRGNYILKLQFFGDINDKREGLFRIPVTDYKENKLWMLATHTLITGAYGLFPCWNDPALKTTFNISIRHHKTHIALSNMPKRDSEKSDIDMVWTHFHITPPISTHDIAVVVIPEFFKPYAGIHQSNNFVMWYSHSLKKYTERAHSVALRVMSFLKSENVLGELKVPQVNYITIPGFQYEAITTLGIVLHREEDIMYDETISFVAQKINVDRFVARQIALQWFIGSMKPSLWSYQWLNGVAEFFGIYALDKIYETSKMMNWFVVHTVHNSLHLDVDNLMEPITEQRNTSLNATHFRVPPFIKVPVLLRLLENTLGHTFWNDTREYLRKESVNDLNFWACMPVLIAPSVPLYENTFRDRICKITSTENYPLLSVKQEDEDVKYIYFTLYVNESFVMGEKYPKMQIPVSYIITNLLTELWNEHTQVYNFQWIQEEIPLKLPVRRICDSPSWLIVNVNQTGYYRVSYADSWDNIGEFLNSSVLYTKIPVLNRAQIIDDAYHFVVKKTISSSTWFKLISYLKNEKEYEAWYPMIRLFEDISGFLPFEDQTIVVVKKQMAHLIDRLLQTIGFINDDKDLFKICLRYEAIKWACLFGSATCEHEAATTLQLILNDSTKNKYQIPIREENIYSEKLSDINTLTLIKKKRRNVHTFKEMILNYTMKNRFCLLLADTTPKRIVNDFIQDKSQILWKEWIYCDGLRNVTGSMHTLERILSNYKLKNNYIDALLKFALCFQYNTVFTFFNDTTYETVLQDSDRVILFQSLVAKHANNHIDDILNKLFFLKPRAMKPSTALCIIINHVYSHVQLLKIKNFLTEVLNYNIVPNDLNQFFEEFKKYIDKDPQLNSGKINIFKERILLLFKKIELRLSQINKHVNNLKELKVLIGL